MSRKYELVLIILAALSGINAADTSSATGNNSPTSPPQKQGDSEAIQDSADNSEPPVSEPWPEILLATEARIVTYDPDNEVEMEKDPRVLDKTASSRAFALTGANGTVCYDLAEPPFLECLKDASPWTPVMYFRNRRDQVHRNSHNPRLELDDFGERLLYLDAGDSKLHLIFLNKDNDRIALLPDQKFETFAIDWNRGVLATVDRNSQLVLWAFNGTDELDQMYNSSVTEIGDFALTLDTQTSTLYMLSSNKFLLSISYENLSPLLPPTIKKSNFQLDVDLGTLEIQIRSHSSAFVYRSFLYFLASNETTMQSICRINSKNVTGGCRPMKMESNEANHFKQLALYIPNKPPEQNPCAVCSHRCFPKFPKGVTCGCPFDHYDVEVDSNGTCTSAKTVAAVIVKNQLSNTSVVRLVNYFNQGTKLVDLDIVTGKRGIQPIGIVPLWTPHDPERFCIQSRVSEELLITCHSYINENNFTEVPWKAPKTNFTLLAITNLNDANSTWIVTWLENNEITLSGCIRYQKSGTSEILTLYCHFSQNDGLWGYTDLQMDEAFLTVDPLKHRIGYLEAEENELIHVMRSKDGEDFGRFPSTMEPFRNSMSLRMNFITIFGNRGLTYATKVKIQTLRMGKPSSSEMVTSRKLFALVGADDYCWLESRRRSSDFSSESPKTTLEDDQMNNIVCARTTPNQAEDTVVFKFSPQESVTSFDTKILNVEEHKNKTSNVCTTGKHNCSHLCTALQGGAKNRYACSCPDEYPILLEGHKCSLRLFIDVRTTNASSSSPDYSLRITEPKAPSIGDDTEQSLQYALASGQLCHIELQGIVCGNEVIPGSSGATHIIKGHNQVRDEIYWLKPSTMAKGRQCVFLSAPGKSMTMRLRCVQLSKIEGHVTVDAERKILFWFNRNNAQKDMPMLNSLNLVNPESKAFSRKMADLLKYDMLQSIACDFSIQKLFAAFYDPVDRNSQIYEISYTSANATKSKLFADFTHQITTIAAVQGNLFWFDKFSGWIYGKRPESKRALKIRKIDETPFPFGKSWTSNMDVLNIASAYTPSEMSLKSLCSNSTCDYFCDVRATSTGPITQCLCPMNLTDPTKISRFHDCVPETNGSVPNPTVIHIESKLALPLGLSFGILIMIVAAGNIVWCVYSRQKQKRKIQHIVRAFMEGDVQRAISSKDNAVKAQFLPFTAIIPPDDLVLNEKKVLGEGNFGTVYEGMYQRTPVAVKTTKSNLDPQMVQDFLRELKIQAYVGEHSNVVSFFGAEVSRIQASRILVVLELCPHGNLLDYMRKYSESENLRPALGVGRTSYIETLATENDEIEEVIEMEQEATTEGIENSLNLRNSLQVPAPTSRVRKAREAPTYTNVGLRRPSDEQPPTVCFHWARQIAAGMEYLESKRVVHGDMAARNILVFENDTVKISDFGFSRNVYQKQTYQKKQNCALPYQWASPETLSRLEFSSKADVWSFGVTMWEIFTFGNMPFANTYWDYYFVDKLVVENMRLTKPPLLTQELHDQLLDVCWKVKPEERASFKELKEALDALYYARTQKD